MQISAPSPPSSIIAARVAAQAVDSNPNSRNKSEALREASVNLLKDRRYRYPFLLGRFCASEQQLE